MKALVRSCAALALTLACLGAQAQAWVVGQVAPLSGKGATQGRAYAQGMRLYFDQLNQAGGVQGRPVQLVVVDDAGYPEDTLLRTRELLAKAKPVVLAGYMGNSNLVQLLQSGLLEKERISLVGYQGNDSEVARSARIFSTRASLKDEIAKIASHLAGVGITRLAVVIEQRPDAQAVFSWVREAVTPVGAQLAAEIELAHGRSPVGLTVEQLQKLKPAPQAILLIASSPATAAFVEAYRLESGSAQIYATSDADIEQLAKRLPQEFISGLSIAQVVPNPYRISMRLNKEFRDAANAQSPAAQVSYEMMEGYVNAKVIAEALRRSQPINRETVTASLRSFNAYDLGGYWVAFKPGSQFGSRFVDLSIVNASGRISQ